MLEDGLVAIARRSSASASGMALPNRLYMTRLIVPVKLKGGAKLMWSTLSP